MHIDEDTTMNQEYNKLIMVQEYFNSKPDRKADAVAYMDMFQGGYDVENEPEPESTNIYGGMSL